MTQYKHILFFACLAILVLTASCYRGKPKDKPPVHLIPDMDSQPRFDSQELNPFFEDNLAMRPPVDGTIAKGELVTDIELATGKDSRDRYIRQIPIPVTMPTLQRGQERYNIYCAPCHSKIGDGKGIMVNRGYIPPPSFHIDRLRDVENGYVYEVIRNGIRNMPSYAHQLSVEDCWAITGYFRALQRSQNADLEDVPQEKRQQLEKN